MYIDMKVCFLLQLETVKRQKLKNPNIFVSSTRLSVHNIPVNVDEKQLKKVFLKACGDKTALVNEVRIGPRNSRYMFMYMLYVGFNIHVGIY